MEYLTDTFVFVRRRDELECGKEGFDRVALNSGRGGSALCLITFLQKKKKMTMWMLEWYLDFQKMLKAAQ